MKKAIDDREGPPDDDPRRGNRPAGPEGPASAGEPKRAGCGGDPAPEQPKRKTQAGAAARKRRKRFVL